ncbi:GNAT family N-acetyltransferase [Cohnella sp.]|uniref:GNAT family N-acetyltransferase n=1 Tax=Cohnella sp. TaxID=1883426 RepID=UPI003568129A
MLCREATLQDEDEVFRLAANLATSFILNKERFSQIYLDIINNSNADLIVAQIDSKIIGYVLVFHHSTFYANGVISWVEELFVLEEHRRKKIGQKLMVLIEEQAQDRGSKLIALATRRASEFYKSIGYTESASYFKKILASTNG